MFKLLKLQLALLVLAILVVVGLLADQLALKPRVEQAIEASVTRSVPGTTGVSAHISSFPFLPRVLVTQTVSKVTVTAATTQASGLPFPLRDLQVEVNDVEIDSNEALHGRLRISSVGAGSAHGAIDEKDVATLLGVPGISIRLDAGKATVTVLGVGVANLTVENGRLELRIANRRLGSAAIPKTDLLPCTPVVTFDVGEALLSCTFSKVPDSLLARLQA